MHHLNKALILKSKLKCAIWSSKSCFCKCSLFHERHGDGDNIDFQRPDHLFVVTLAWSVLGMERRALATAAMYPYKCVLPMVALSGSPAKYWSSARVTTTPAQKWWFSFPSCSQRHKHNLQPQADTCCPIASTTSSRSGSLVRWVESTVSSTCTHVAPAAQMY